MNETIYRGRIKLSLCCSKCPINFFMNSTYMHGTIFILLRSKKYSLYHEGISTKCKFIFRKIDKT